MALFDIGESLGQTIVGAGASSVPDPKRVPMNFTSTLRLRRFDPEFQSISRTFATGEQLESLQIRLAAGEAVIQMAVNPNSISWRQAKRITKRDTQEGSVYYHFTNSKGENNDILVLDFRGNTGLIDKRGDIDSNTGTFSTSLGSSTGAVKKMTIWHDLWNLTREPILLEDGIINEFLISYSSPIIPVEIELVGFFNEVMQWEDSAEKPFTKDYSFSFTVQDVVPPLDEIIDLISVATFDPGTTQTT